jgi:hypothetical protein
VIFAVVLFRLLYRDMFALKNLLWKVDFEYCKQSLGFCKSLIVINIPINGAIIMNNASNYILFDFLI